MGQFFTDCFASLEQQSTSALKGDEVAYWNSFFQDQETGGAHHPFPLLCEELEVSMVLQNLPYCLLCIFNSLHYTSQ